jgi:hypothetical protein
MITEREKFLWDLLDNIDTAFDRFRPEMHAFEEYVQTVAEERHHVLVSDGYELFEPKPEVEEP